MFVQPRGRAGYLITDTAITDPMGALLHSCGKIVYGLGRFPWAAGISGDVHPKIVCAEIGAFNPLSYKQLMKGLPGALRSAVERQASGRKVDPTSISLHLTGVAWDHSRKRPVGFTILSKSGLNDAGLEPYVYYELPWSFSCGESAEARSYVEAHCPTEPDRFDPEKDGLALVEIQRAARINAVSGLDLIPAYRIGCEVIMATVSKKGVALKCLHDFGDKVGEKIDPAFNSAPAPLAVT